MRLTRPWYQRLFSFFLWSAFGLMFVLGLVMASALWSHPHSRPGLWLTGEDHESLLWVVRTSSFRAAFVEGQSPVLTQANPFVRLGLRWDSPSPVRIEARFEIEQGLWSPWTTALTTWNEGKIYVGHADPPTREALSAQIRLTASVMPTFFAAELIRNLGPAAYISAMLPSRSSSSSQAPQAPQVGQGRAALTGPFNPRSAWNAAAPKCTSPNPTKTRISVHHTVTPNNDMNPESRLRGIQAYHQNTQGWCDIGYHLLISWDGRAWEGRPAELLGTHVGNQNTNNLGISFLGTFHSSADPDPPAAMTCQGSKLIDWGVKTFGVARNRTSIIGHRENPGQSTSCPGDRLLAQIASMVQNSTSPTCGGTTNPPPCDYVKTTRLSGGSVNVRPASNTSQAPLGTIPEGECLKVDAKDANGQEAIAGNGKTWYKVTYNGISGWIYGYYAECSDCGPPPVQTAKIKGVVFLASKPDMSDRISGATVKLNVGNPVTTGADGAFEFTIPPGTYTVTVTKAGYVDASRQAIAVAGQDVWASVGLTPVGTEQDKTPPTIKITSPKDGDILSASTATITGEATDNKAVARVEVNGKEAKLTGSTFTVEIGLQLGPQPIKAVAFDASNNEASASITLTYQDQGHAEGGEEKPAETALETPSEPSSTEPTPPDASSEPSAPDATGEKTKDDFLTIESPAKEIGPEVVACRTNLDCPTGTRCKELRCQADPKTLQGGCSCSSSPAHPLPLLWLFAIFFLLRRRSSPSP